jgi:hypothetical protein
MCGQIVFSYTNSDFKDKLFADAYKGAFRDHLNAVGTTRICCDKFNDAVRTGSPCDPTQDLDCDGQPNTSDLESNGIPDIDTFVQPNNAAIDTFPPYLDRGNPDFQPNRTAQNSKDVGSCPCKWQMTKGELVCSPDGKQQHHYKATWKCPTTGAEVVTVRYAAPTAPCEK